MRNPLSLTLALLLFAAALLLPAALAQNETTQTGPRNRARLTRPGGEDLDRVFRSYERLSLDTADAAERVRQTGRLVINTGRRVFDLELEPHDMRAATYTAEETIAPGVKRRVEMGAVRTYKGRVLGSGGMAARFTIDEESLEGLILTRDELYYVEPARRYLPSAARTEFLFYKASDVIETDPASCAADSLHGKVAAAAGQLGEDSPTASAAVTGGGPQPLALATPLEAELATEADFEYVNALGGSAAANAEILSIMNQVEGIYQRDIGLSFRITNQHTWATSADPYAATDAVALLNELTKYWNANFTNVQRDVVHMWTGKNVTYNGDARIAGVAWGGGSTGGGVVCKNGGASSYGLSERRTETPNKFVLPAHELGHNFDGVHTDGVAGCGSTVMRSYAGPDSVLSFCAASINRITAHINANSSCLSAAPVCTFTISPTSASFTAAGGSNSFAVTASDASCNWTATTTAAWIHITAGAAGTGSGMVSYTVDANTATT
ncbi:MAG TPA: M12 family metallo-peptidase, partial [Pyrinomonadaceae bacterium]|nr:M12 family metallo-peptidase [Pyrinomonadaceae bacterium]